MNFRLEFTPPAFSEKLDITDKILLTGSCFTEHMCGFLERSKFRVMQNPNGVLFNPISIFDAILAYIKNQQVSASDLFQHKGLWKCWSFHSSFAGADKEETIQQINLSIKQAHEFIQSSKWLFITLGSAYVYSLENGRIVANCHKQTPEHFEKRLLRQIEITESFMAMYGELKKFNPDLRVIFTVSPVRHLKDGFIQNNRSKAILINAIDEIINKLPEINYFPAYELIIDDLRDYRFYAEDMVHPNYQATRYVWEKFSTACLNGRTREIIKEIEIINSARNHEVMHPGSEEHVKFIEKFRDIVSGIQLRFPMLDFSAESAYFK